MNQFVDGVGIVRPASGSGVLLVSLRFQGHSTTRGPSGCCSMIRSSVVTPEMGMDRNIYSLSLTVSADGRGSL